MELPFKIKDFSDKRGFSFELDAGLEHFHIVSLKPGYIRGNHSHSYNEIAIVLGGKGIALIETEDNSQWSSIKVENDFYPVMFPAYVKHRIKNVGNREFYLVCFSYKK